MKRRTVLSAVGAGVATGLAGCLGTGPAPGGDGDSDGNDDDSSGDDSSDGTTTDSPDGSGSDGADGTDSDGSDGSDGSDDSDDSGDGGADDGTSTASPTPRVEDSSFSAGSAACGSGVNTASITVEATDDSADSPAAIVSVTGAIRGRDQCYSARLDGVSYDASSDALSVTVVSYVPDNKSDSVCGQCIVDIEYEATVEVGGSVPGTITVTHGDEAVAKQSTATN